MDVIVKELEQIAEQICEKRCKYRCKYTQKEWDDLWEEAFKKECSGDGFDMPCTSCPVLRLV